MNNSKPKVLAILPAFIPSTHICIIKPMVGMHRANLIHAKITLEYLVSQRSLEWADLVIFCRNTEPRYDYMLDFLLSRRIPFVYDIDDNFFEAPLDSEEGEYHRNPGRLAAVTRYIETANWVRVYSEPMLEQVRGLNEKVEMVSGPIDWSLISPVTADSRRNPVRVVYATSRFDDQLAALFMPGLNHILSEYAGKVEVHFWGTKPRFVNGGQRIQHHSFVPDYDKFIRRFSQGGFDIGLAPMKDDSFHRSKTNNKFREYSSCQIAGIYSDVDVYSSCVTNGETGLLVSNSAESWRNAIARLIEDHDLRRKIQRQAQDYVRGHYSQGEFERVWWDQIQQVLAGRGTHSVAALPQAGISGSPSGKVEDRNWQEQTILDHLTTKVRNFVVHFKNDGLRFSLHLFRERLHDFLMVVKLRFFTSSVLKYFRSPKVVK